MAVAPNAQYTIMAEGSLADRIAASARRRMFDHFLHRTRIGPGDTLLDVGVTSAQRYAAANYVEAWYHDKERITAVGIDDASFLESAYPGVRFCRADGLALPFPDRSFDVVHSSAVLEHVGGFDRQSRFIAEAVRVARRAAFVTTPNRWYPVEFHTMLPLAHWLPRPAFRRLLRGLGLGFFADERNLNLIGARELAALCGGLAGCTVAVETISTFGLPSNLLLTVEKRPAA